MQEGNSYWTTKKGKSYLAAMADDTDSVRELVKGIATTYPGGMNALSLAVGQNVTYIQQYIRRGSPKELSRKVRLKLAEISGRHPDQFLPPDLSGASDRRIQAHQANALPTAPVFSPAQRRGGEIPVLGQGAAGENGEFPLSGTEVEWVLPPEMLDGVRGAYALYVYGNSMAPRYEHGERVYVHPNQPVERGDYVVVQIAGDEGAMRHGYIKKFVSRDARLLKLTQLNPPKNLQFPADRVIAVHRIVQGGD